MSKIKKITDLGVLLINKLKSLTLSTLDFIGVLSSNKQLSTDTALLVAIVIKFLTVPAPNFADIPAIIGLIASRVHKRQIITKHNKELIEKELEKTKQELSVKVKESKQVELRNQELEAQIDRRSGSKTSVWKD